MSEIRYCSFSETAAKKQVGDDKTWHWHINYLNVANGHKYIFTRLFAEQFCSFGMLSFPLLRPLLEDIQRVIEIFGAKVNVVQSDIQQDVGESQRRNLMELEHEF